VKIATWNVNGIRARESQLLEWIGRDRPDVVCLQEIKAPPDNIPLLLCELDGYWCYWHGERAYSGVALHLLKETFPERPAFSHPTFDHETRIVVARAGGLSVASIYVPNGGKDFPAKLKFLEALEDFVGREQAGSSSLVLCGDLNVARTDQDVHPKERRQVIGQLPEERELLERILTRGVVDIGRSLDPDNADLFSWWAPWRNMRQRNIGWRLDYVLASAPAGAPGAAIRVLADVGTSDTRRRRRVRLSAVLSSPRFRVVAEGPEVEALAGIFAPEGIASTPRT
jgi:exodeoxyribonuclease-3